MSLSTQPISEVFTWKESNSQVWTVIDQIQKLVGVLSEEWQKEIVCKDKRIDELLGLIQMEVKQRRKELNYHYLGMDYERRLSIDKEVFDKILNEKVLTYELWEHYRELLSLVNLEVMWPRLLVDYWFEDLVYEALVKWEYNKNIEDIDYEGPKKRLDNNDWDDLNGVKFFNFLSINLWNVWKSDLKAIFKNFRICKKVNLNLCSLSRLWKDELDVIFKYLRLVRHIDLSSNNIWNLEKDKLEVIFKYLNWVKHINLSSNGLWNLWIEELKVVFKNLSSVEYMNLFDNKFSEEQKRFIESLLPNTKINF